MLHCAFHPTLYVIFWLISPLMTCSFPPDKEPWPPYTVCKFVPLLRIHERPFDDALRGFFSTRLFLPTRAGTHRRTWRRWEMGLWVISVARKRGLCCLFRRYNRPLVIHLQDTLNYAPFPLFLQDPLQMHLSKLSYSPVPVTANFLFLITPRQLFPGGSQPTRLHGLRSFTPHRTRCLTTIASIIGIPATHCSALTLSRTVSPVSTPTPRVTRRKPIRSKHSCVKMVWPLFSYGF
jgi:hypothetical protein